MFSSVRWPLALAFFLLIAVGVCTTELVVFQAARHSYLDTVEAGLTRDCSLIANLMRRHMDQTALTAAERKMITDEMARLSLSLSGRLCVVNWQGDVLEDSAHRSGQNLSHRPEIRSALAGQTETAIRGLEGSSDQDEDWEQVLEPTMFVAVPLLARDKVMGAIYGQRSLTDLQLMLLNLRELLYETALGSLAAALLLSLLLARWLTSPLTRLTRVVKHFGEGHLEERSPLQSRNEIGSLARAFNDMADRLERHHETLLQFVSDASHELKTPLACLRSLIEALEGGALEQPQARDKFLEHIHRELDRMDHLVADLLELHKLDRAAPRLELAPLPLQPFLQEVLEELGGRLAPARLELECPEGTGVVADPQRLRQVLTNLLENARRAVAEQLQPRVRLRVATGENQAHIWVEDNGTGLAPHLLERVFDRFYRVDRGRARADGGSGLGLAITRSWVEAMGGRISAHSQGPGQGASFCVTLPREGA